MLQIIATITTLPGKRDEVLGLFKALIPKVLAEDGCHGYSAFIDVPAYGKIQSPIGPDVFVILERWESTAALKAHATSAHMAEYGAHVGPLLASRVINVLQSC